MSRGNYFEIHQGRFEDLGAALRSCREIFQTLWDLKFYEPSTYKPSQAHADFVSQMAGRDGTPLPMDLNKHPRSTAMKLLHQQADFCVSLGLLVRAGEIGDPASALVRTLVEYATRIYWVLDLTITHRKRCARAVLFELVSLSHTRDAVTGLPINDEARVKARSTFRRMKKATIARFFDVKLDNDPIQWLIENEKYRSWTNATDAWCQAIDPSVNGAALYKLLAVQTHPQGFSGTFGLSFDESGIGARIIPFTRVERLVQLSLVTFYNSLKLIANYHGHHPKELVAWEDYLEHTVPGIFRPTADTGQGS